jgi:osomolarity two-component system phosphorelay intermediate protein YPD1
VRDFLVPSIQIFPLMCLFSSALFRGKKALGDLSSLGHFLKGSSAALGVSKVQSLCEDIQNYGNLREGTAIITEAEAVAKITKAIAHAREEYKEAKKWLNTFYQTYRSQH